jgi:hypothetical protein
MSNPNADPVNPEIKVCPELKDKIFDHLSPQARAALMGVEVKFWPNNHEEMELRLKYDPTDNILDIDATEAIYGPDEKITGSFVRGCELNSETGEVHAYVEHMVAPGTLPPIDYSLVAAENDANRFDAEKLNFLMRLFDCL